MADRHPGFVEHREEREPHYGFFPKKDMTAWELAYILRFTTDLPSGISSEIYNQFPLEVQRHFQTT
ncbi:hypothetical protein [Planctomyces sp. SH-PL14]|uniref:hypothetical protein n=1 Tax=Planctomyces sp. SH-PL14 TaxID=1632864 RepID=UPI00078EDC23|nr:hypothetical protein [Planctomyces sp. SH-PL14]AMV16624.1 hypothetical protein VT03_01960 [Planctomyces sp. SH-PL14]